MKNGYYAALQDVKTEVMAALKKDITFQPQNQTVSYHSSGYSNRLMFQEQTSSLIIVTSFLVTDHNQTNPDVVFTEVTEIKLTRMLFLQRSQ